MRARRPYLIISAAWLIHAVAWFVPVIKGGVTLPHGLPGWEAFRVAACAITGCHDVTYDSWYGAAMAAVSAVVTVLFIVGSPVVVWRSSRRLCRIAAVIAAIGFVDNTHWFVIFGGDTLFYFDLRIGYFLWWWSFLALAIGLFDLSQSERQPLHSACHQIA